MSDETGPDLPLRRVAIVDARGPTRPLVELPCHPERTRDVWNLLPSCLDEWLQGSEDKEREENHRSSHFIQWIQRRPASDAELCAFHMPDYVSYLRQRCQIGDSEEEDDNDVGDTQMTKRARTENAPPPCPRLLKELPPKKRDSEYGLSGAAAPPFPAAFVGASLVAGGSIDVATAVGSGAVDVGIHWEGGRHHAKRDEASGFCYFNDVVLAANALRSALTQRTDGGQTRRVLVLDVDVHHGDGTEAAFLLDSDTMCISMHQFGPGLYPTGSGQLNSIGLGDAKGTNINLPFPCGATGSLVVPAVQRAVAFCQENFRPHGVVVVCGCDALRGDPLGTLALSLSDLGVLVETALNLRLPTVLLGAGGYVPSNAARAFALFTHIALFGKFPPPDMPIPDSVLETSMYLPSLRLVPPQSAPFVENATLRTETRDPNFKCLHSMEDVESHLRRISKELCPSSSQDDEDEDVGDSQEDDNDDEDEEEEEYSSEGGDDHPQNE